MTQDGAFVQPDLYKTLGVARDATSKEIKSAYRRLARQHHPDLNPGDAGAGERFKQVAAAYEVLSDPALRRRYDRTGRRGPGESRPTQAAAAFVRAFQASVDQMGRLFQQEILPRYIDAYYRGLGVGLVHHLLRDIEQYALLKRLNLPEPTQWARTLAAFTTATCTIRTRMAIVVDDDGRPVLGRAFRDIAVVRGQVALAWRMQLFVGSFHRAGYTDPTQLDMAVLQVIARETVRMLERSVPARHRPLERRELGMDPMTSDAVRAADSWGLMRKWGGLVLIVLLLAALVAAILPGFV